MSQPASPGIMNGMSRFLSRRDKRGNRKDVKRSVSTDLYQIFSVEEPAGRKLDKEEEKKYKAILQRLAAAGITTIKEPQIEYALKAKATEGDSDKAVELLMLFQETLEGMIKDYDPNIKLLGAENRHNVTCYLDALLFAMFSRLDSFEGILLDNFTDEPRRRLAALLRLWVNMLRTGRLITTDITKHIQESLGACGWESATEICQQDASEAFTFITGQLELPLLTLKMDIYHTGKEDVEDDHKFVNERLLEVAIPDVTEHDGPVTLEDCLEAYFNNKIEVKRHLQRRTTLQSVRSSHTGKENTVHIENVEVSDSRASSPRTETPTNALSPASPLRPSSGRRRTDSIFSERYVKQDDAMEKKDYDEYSLNGRSRGTSIRKEVMMPAWQFFSLIPWYTDNAPTSDAQVAAHFSAKRPVLGICLKRYSMLPNGTPQRLGTYVDIPLEIALPHFVSDDKMEEEGPLFGNFKLSLQSVVCHRGVSVDSGHYISLVRGHAPNAESNSSQEALGPDEKIDQPRWIRFDDLAPERVSYIDIEQALKEESPYLLFYRVEPIDEDLARGAPPTYSEANPVSLVSDPSQEALSTTDGMITVDCPDSTHLQLDEGPRGRTSTSSNHRSIVFEEGSVAGSSTRGTTAPPTPLDDYKPGFLSASRRGSRNSKKSKSRPTSQNGEREGRLSITMSRLAGRMSRDKLTSAEANGTVASEDSAVVVEGVDAGSKEKGKGKPSKKIKKHRSSSRLGLDDEQRGKDVPERECIVM